MKDEIYKHKKKIIAITTYDEITLDKVFDLICSKIQFIEENLLSESDVVKALKYTESIDENDTLFVALAIHFQTMLWTGEMKLINGLESKGFKKTITTRKMYLGYLSKQTKSNRKK